MNHATHRGLACQGFAPTPLPLEIAVKATVITLFLFDYWKFSAPFIPWLDAVDRLSAGAVVLGLQVAFFTGSLLVFYRPLFRVGCILVALSVIGEILVCLPAYRNAKVFSVLLLLLTALRTDDRFPSVRAQIVIVYIGTGLNKLFESDWHDGQFFMSMFGERYGGDWFFFYLFKELPLWVQHTTAVAMAWGTILLEAAIIPIGLCVARWRTLAIWIAIWFHGLHIVTIGVSFSGFFSFVLFSLLAFVEWPTQVHVWVDSQRWSHRLLAAWHRLFNRRQPWDLETATGRFRVRVFAREYSGWRAVKRFFLYQPAFHYALAVLLALGPGKGPTIRAHVFNLSLAAALWLVSAPAEQLRDWLARRRPPRRASTDDG